MSRPLRRCLEHVTVILDIFCRWSKRKWSLETTKYVWYTHFVSVVNLLLKYTSYYFMADAKGGTPLPVHRDVGQCVKRESTVKRQSINLWDSQLYLENIWASFSLTADLWAPRPLTVFQLIQAKFSWARTNHPRNLQFNLGIFCIFICMSPRDQGF